MDQSVAPGDDFFAYANGAWLKTTDDSRPTAAPTASASSLVELTQKRTTDLIKEARGAGRSPAGSEARKIGDYYASLHGRSARSRPWA